jgi:hypothetical protein
LHPVKTLFVVLALAGIGMTVPALAQTRISFSRGSDSGIWSGYISEDGSKTFILNARKGQTLWVLDGELPRNVIYSWQLVTPSGRTLGCRGSTYCLGDDSIRLPESGDFLVHTTYRLSTEATSPVTPRYVSVTFTIR